MGFLPVTPPADRSGDYTKQQTGGDIRSGDWTDLARPARRQLLIDFAARATRLETTAARSEHKLDELKDGQAVALGVLHEIRSLVGARGGQAPVANASSKGSSRKAAPGKTARPADRSEELVGRGRDVLRWIETLDAGMREKFILRCRAHLGPAATDWIVNDHLASGIFKTVTFAEELAADWRRRICLPATRPEVTAP